MNYDGVCRTAPATPGLLIITYYQLHVSWVMYHLSCVMCHVICVMCPVSCVLCHVSCVMCHVSCGCCQGHDGPRAPGQEESAPLQGELHSTTPVEPIKLKNSQPTWLRRNSVHFVRLPTSHEAVLSLHIRNGAILHLQGAVTTV